MNQRINKTVRLGLGLSLGMAALALSGAATAATPATKWKTVEHWGWKAEISDTWKEVEKVKTNDAKPYDGMWKYYSPTKNFRLKVKVRAESKGTWVEQTKHTYDTLHKKIPEFKLLAANSKQIEGRDIFYLFGQVERVRNTKSRTHLVAHVLIKFKRGLTAVVTLHGTEDKIDTFEEVFAHFLDTFALVDPKSADKAVTKLQGGK